MSVPVNVGVRAFSAPMGQRHPNRLLASAAG